MGHVVSRFGSVISPLVLSKSIWAVKLRDDKWLCELDQRFEIRSGSMRPLDWSLDIVDNSDQLKIKELWLFAPPSCKHPQGMTRFLTIEEPGTAFQFKVANVDVLGAYQRTQESQIIGKVTDKESGACTCWIWDCLLQEIREYKSNVYRFGTWRGPHEPQLAPIGALSHEVMGFRLSPLSSYSPHNP